MALKCIFRFENLDSTRDLNQRSEHLFKKGIYYGGKVTIEPSNVNTIKVPPFRLISHDGMHVLSDSDILLPINVGEFYIVCRAKYVIDDSPDISVFSIDDSTFDSLNDEEKSYYIVFAHVSCDGINITDVNIKDYKEEITQIGRNQNRGYFESEQELLNIEAFEGDFATVKSDNSSEILPYIYNGTEWISFPNNRVFNVYLTNHRTNKDVLVQNTLESVSDDKKNKGAYHINWNQLHGLKNFEFENGHEKISKTQSFYKKDYVQVIPLEYKAIKDNNTDVSINNLSKVDNIGSLTEGNYFVDYDNCLVYAWTPSNSQTTEYEINYYCSYKEKLVVSEIEFNKIPRPSELDALKGNNYGINFVNKAPSKDNLFITSNSPVPKTKIGTFNVETVDNEYYLTTEETNIFIGDDNYKKYFEVLDLENGLPVYIDVVKVIDNGVIRDVDEENVNEYRNGWFIKRTNCKLALKIVNIGTFTASSLSNNKKVAYHVESGLGDIVEVDNIDYLTNQNNEKNLLKAKNITFDTLFSVDNDDELSINSASVKGINHNTKISTLLNSEIRFFYNNNKVGSIGAVRDNNESFLSIESIEDLNILSHKDIFIESKYSQTKNSEISFEENESKFKVTNNDDYAQIKLVTSDSSIVRTIIDSVSAGMAIVTISSNNKSAGPYIEVKNDENQSSLYNRGSIKLVSQRTINYIDYRSSITEMVDSIELKNSTESKYSRYYSFDTRILLENGEVETDSPDNTDTRKYSNVKIEKDNISLNTIYGTVTYSKYLSEIDNVTIESGETENPSNVSTRKYSNVEIGSNYIVLNTKHGSTVYVDASINLEDDSISMYSSLFEINTVLYDNNEYGIKINSIGTNKGVIVGTDNFTNYVEINENEINLDVENKGKVSISDSLLLLELRDSSTINAELRLSSTSILIELNDSVKTEYTSSGVKTESYNSSKKSDVVVNTSNIYLSTYSSTITNNTRVDTIESAIELSNTEASIYVGKDGHDKCSLDIGTNQIVLDYTIVDYNNDTRITMSNVELSESKIDMFNYYEIKLHTHNDSFIDLSNNSISLNNKESNSDGFSSISLNNGIVLYKKENGSNSFSSLSLGTGKISNSVKLINNGADDVVNYININNTSSNSYITLGIDEIDSNDNAATKIKLLMSNSSNAPYIYTASYSPYVSDRFVVVIGNDTYFIPLILSPQA